MRKSVNNFFKLIVLILCMSILCTWLVMRYFELRSNADEYIEIVEKYDRLKSAVYEEHNDELENCQRQYDEVKSKVQYAPNVVSGLEKLITTINSHSSTSNKFNEIKKIIDTITENSIIGTPNTTNALKDFTLYSGGTEEEKSDFIEELKGKINLIRSDITSINNARETNQQLMEELERELQRINAEIQAKIDELDAQMQRELENIDSGNKTSGDLREATLAKVKRRGGYKNSTGISSFEGKAEVGALYYEDLRDKQYILCRQHGGILRARGIGYWLNYKGSAVSARKIIATGAPVPDVSPETIANFSWRDAYPASIYIIGEPTFSGGGAITANAMEAYVLAHLGGKSGHPSDEQIAWWCTILSNHDRNIITGTSSTCGLAEEALAFSNFIGRFKGTGKSYGGFKLDDPKFMDGKKKVEAGTYDFDKIIVTYKDGEYKIGPFAIDYVKKIEEGKVYGGIEKLTLITDKNQDGLTLDEGNMGKWEVLYYDGRQRDICS